jgi:hypothetical protein
MFAIVMGERCEEPSRANLMLLKQRFKTNVRKLKELGLTESLEVGYRLSPRGKTGIERL